MVVEGLVISKIPYKERDLIVKLILRNGLMASFYLYGGQGGGKYNKPLIFDVGVMMQVKIKESKSFRKDGSDLMQIDESKIIWSPKSIRHHFQAFYLMCLFFEMVQKFAITFKLGESDFTDDQDGIFSVLSNALFYIDESVAKNQFIPEQHSLLFLVKLLFHLGIMPNLNVCSFCSTPLENFSHVSLMIENGQFSCSLCAMGENDKNLFVKLKRSFQTKYQDYIQLEQVNFNDVDKLIKYFCHHFNLRPIELKSYSLLFK